jgi:hypothetical protein
VTRRVHRLPLIPAPHPVQLALGLDGGVLAVLGKRAKGRKYVPGGSFPIAAAKRAERAA